MNSNNLKKTLKMLCLPALLILFSSIWFSLQSHDVQFKTDESGTLVLSMKAGEGQEILYPWTDENSGITYFFIPSFILDNDVYCDHIGKEWQLQIDGKILSKREKFKWEEQTVYSISCWGQEYDVMFMKSANLPALFLETDSGSMEYLNANKENEEAGEINLIEASGNIEYQGRLKKISGRGNSTFATAKKPYTFTLEDAYPLCGLDMGKKWNLLALHYEEKTMQSKLIHDMATYLEMEYTSGSKWVDLYCNGNYQGLYLLTEAITVGDGRVEIYDLEKENKRNTKPSNISGGYLLERDVTESLEPTEVYFTTDICNYNFVINTPKVPTEEEYSYIKDFVQNIENLLVSDDTGYKNYIDLDSFAKQFLIDKLVLNPDAMRSSTFYYKDRDSDVLKVGPLWDYDRAMGVSMPDYETAVGDYPDTMNDWYMPLYADEEFYQKLLSYYEQLLPYLQELAETKIDDYAELLGPSIAMDTTMWPLGSVYTEHESYVRYLKYFLANRIRFLNEVWNVSGTTLEGDFSSGEEHTVCFYAEDGTLLDSYPVKDGECITSLPELDQDSFEWRYHLDGKGFDPHYPVFEDVDLYVTRKFSSPEEQADYKLEKIRNESSLENYLCLLQDTDLSLCIYLPSSSKFLKAEEDLLKIEELCPYQLPEKLREAAKTGQDFFLLIDNGWETVWESVGGEALNELSTTLGMVDYQSSEDGERHLYIQNMETDYLEILGEDTEVQFVVIDRLTGSIEDVAVFTETEKIQ